MAAERASAASVWRWSSSRVLPYSLLMDQESAATERSSSEMRSPTTTPRVCCCCCEERSESSGANRIPAICISLSLFLFLLQIGGERLGNESLGLSVLFLLDGLLESTDYSTLSMFQLSTFGSHFSILLYLTPIFFLFFFSL